MSDNSKKPVTNEELGKKPLNIKVIISIVVLIAIAVFTFVNRDCFNEFPLKGVIHIDSLSDVKLNDLKNSQWNPAESINLKAFASYQFDSPTNIFVGKNNQLYLIDQGKKKIIVTNEKASYVGELTGGSLNKDFYYANLVEDDEDGNIYVADVVYSGKGTLISKERIIKFDSKLNYLGILYEKNYETDDETEEETDDETEDETEDAPYQYGNIVELRQENGFLYAVVKEDEKIVRYELSTEVDASKPDGRDMESASSVVFPIEDTVSDASYDNVTGKMIASTRTGNIVSFGTDGEVSVLFEGNGEEVPWNLTVNDDGVIYFAELVSCGFYEIRDGEVTPIATGDSSYYTADCNEAGTFVTTDYARILYGTEESVSYIENFPIKNAFLHCMVWMLAILGSLYVLFLVVWAIIYLIKAAKDKEQVVRVAMILIASLLCSVTIIALMLQNISKNQNDTRMKELSLFATMMADKLNVDQVQQITTTNDYESDLYNEVKEPLDLMVETGYQVGSYYYYVLYAEDDDYFNGVMDYENSLTVHQPIYAAADEANVKYVLCMEEGEEQQQPSERSSYGTWSFVLEPIKDSAGNVVAILEVGANMDDVSKQRQELFTSVLFTTGTAGIVIVMLLMEILFVIRNRQGEKEGIESPTQYAPLRMVVFLIYLASSMQEPFIAQLCSQLYDGSLPIPDGLAQGLPMSADLLMAAIFSLVAGKVIGYVGTKKTMILGTVASLIGFLICGIVGNYYGILIGKCLIGAGMGTVYVAANTLAASGRDEEDCGKAFAGISAGVLSGITVGDGLASIILSFASFKLVYIIGGVIMVVGFFIALRSTDLKATKDIKADKNATAEISLKEFLFNKRVLPFFLMILLPFMVMLSYRDYFFPNFAEDHGMDEVTIGRLFLICGLIVIYIGPNLSEYLIKQLGAKKAAIFASILMFANVALFVIVPTFTTAVVGVIIFSINISFAYSCQYAYFASVPECEKYGESDAMGIYSMIENAGQAIGPTAFGAVLALGNRQGIMIAGIIFGALLFIFLFSLIGKKQAASEKTSN